MNGCAGSLPGVRQQRVNSIKRRWVDGCSAAWTPADRPYEGQLEELSELAHLARKIGAHTVAAADVYGYGGATQSAPFKPGKDHARGVPAELAIELMHSSAEFNDDHEEKSNPAVMLYSSSDENSRQRRAQARTSAMNSSHDRDR